MRMEVPRGRTLLTCVPPAVKTRRVNHFLIWPEVVSVCLLFLNRVFFPTPRLGP